MKPTLPSIVLFLFALTVSAFGQPAPVITFVSAPRQVVMIGQSLTLRVDAVGPSALTYQWKQNGRAIPGANAPSYRIENASPNRDNGWYQAVVTDSGGATTTSSVIFVNVAIESARVVSARVGQPIFESGDLGPLVSIAAGGSHWLALRADGTVAAGGGNYAGQTDVPQGLTDVVGIAASNGSSLALKSNGRLVVWGTNPWIADAPRAPHAVPIPSDLTQVVKIAAGQAHVLALKSDGTLVGFGRNDDGQVTPRNLNSVIGIAAGYNTSFAWNVDGEVLAWGRDDFRVFTGLLGIRGVTEIAAGEDFAVALMNDGRLNGIGPGYSGAGNVPLNLPSMVGLAAGDWHVIALDSGGRTTEWGSGSPIVPGDDRETFAVSANEQHSLFLRGSRSSSAQSPLVLASPRSHTVALGSTAVLAVSATGSAGLTFQWTRNGALLPGAGEATLVITSTTSADAGHYVCHVTNATGSAESAAAMLTVTATSSLGRIVNLSALASVGVHEQALNLGFTISATGSGSNASVLVRGVGPSLSQFGVSSALTDPTLALFASGGKISENDQWKGDPQVVSLAARVGAFPLASGNSKDSALALLNLPPGAYSVIIGSADGSPGFALGELYDASPAPQSPGSPRGISNASVRAKLAAGDGGLVVGLIVGGETSRSFLIRAIGPSLASFGVSRPLADPELRIASGSTLVGTNDDWIPHSRQPETTVGAFQLPPGSKDAAVLVTLAPGAHVAQVRGKDDADGVVLVEVYELP